MDKKQLQTLKLAHQFKFFTKFFTLNIILSLTQVVWSQTPEQIYQQGQIIKQNTALFRVVDTVFTLDEIKQISFELKQFFCALNESILFNSLQFKNSDLKLIEKIKYQKQYDATQIGIFEKLRIYEKINVYIEAQSVSVNQSVYETLKSSSKLNGCGVESFLTPSLKKIIKMEIYFRSRFFDKTVNKAAANEVQQFLDSVEKQIFHEKYY